MHHRLFVRILRDLWNKPFLLGKKLTTTHSIERILKRFEFIHFYQQASTESENRVKFQPKKRKKEKKTRRNNKKKRLVKKKNQKGNEKK